MKKTKYLFNNRFQFLMFFFISLTIVSCNNIENSIEKDAKKLVTIEFKIQKIKENARAGDMFMKEELERLVKDTIALSREILKKYSSFSDRQKFYEAFSKEKNKCNFFNK